MILDYYYYFFWFLKSCSQIKNCTFLFFMMILSVFGFSWIFDGILDYILFFLIQISFVLVSQNLSNSCFLGDFRIIYCLVWLVLFCIMFVSSLTYHSFIIFLDSFVYEFIILFIFFEFTFVKIFDRINIIILAL